ncbi:MAG: SH3 domain-containing protein [Bacteroidaceae bacterium]|nr:SH3 domain-containing protein [Bacteroidaceae bacterium]
MRSKPSTKSLVVGVLNREDTISVMEISNGWASFTFKDNTRYVSASYLEKVEEPEEEEKPEDITQSEPIEESIKPTITPSAVQEPNSTKKKQKKRSISSNDGQLHLIADIFGGYSNFRCDRVTPEPGIGFGCDIGIQCDYNWIWNKIPNGLFGEFTIGYSCRGSGAYPLHGIGARFLPIGYKYNLNSSWALAGKTGIYLAYPFSGIETGQRSYSGSFDCGISIALGAEWKRFGLMASYEHGFTNVITGSYVDLYNQGAFLTLSYKFLSFK